jgi:beta-lactamase superfamily II metal-dependent hydrolase
MTTRFLLLPALFACGLFAAQGELNIYFVDVEGGGGTLIVGPTGESLLIDTGIPGAGGRDPKRIYGLAANVAHLKKIDSLLITHYHGDHIGGAPELSTLIPIGRYLDHGDLTLETEKPAMQELWNNYKAVAGNNRTILKAGDPISLKGVNVTVVSAAGQAITKPLKGGRPNPLCKDAQQKPTDIDPENGSSVGILLTYGKFRFINLGDLPWLQEQALACPANMIGTVDVYQTTHHGLDRSGSPQLVWALKPRVAIMNNGSRKGGAPLTFETLRKSPGFEDLWQGHFSVNADKAIQSDEKMIANMEPTGECKGNWIHLRVEANGKYTVTNGRNNFSKTYSSR